MGITINFKHTYINTCSTIGGKKEKNGLIGKYIDKCYSSLYAGRKTYEESERKMLLNSINVVLKKANMHKEDIELIIGGDLTNQIVNSSLTAKEIDSSFIGTYGACSTSLLSLGLGSIFISNNICKNVLTFTSSNFGSAERQFRYPTSYGIKKRETTTITVSGASSVLLTNKKTKIKVESFTIGKTIDSNTSDALDMGSIMAKAAYDTLLTHINNKNKKIEEYDYILTGDLGIVGLNVLKDMLEFDSYFINNIFDAGTMIFDLKNEKNFQGGSGPACLPLVCFSYIYNMLIEKKINNVLLIATGSLHSKTSVAQKMNIPVIAHAIELKRV